MRVVFGKKTAHTLLFASLALEVLCLPGYAATTTVTPSSTPFYVPPHTRGDAEYAGHGPHVRVDVSLTVKNPNEVWATLKMHAVETRSDWTTASGSKSFLVYRHSSPIRSIASSCSAWLTYTDTNHGTDVFTGKGPVRSFEIVGDRSGHDAGRHTGVRVHFNPIQINAKTGHAEKTGELILKWMGVVDNGEGDKSGWPLHHGPHGNIHAQIYDAKGDEISHYVIQGPSKNEWVDLDQKSFGNGLILYRWTGLDETISIRLWESDPGPFREHDVLYYMTIRRQNTTNGPYISYDSRLDAAPDVMRAIQKSTPPGWYTRTMKELGLKKPPKLFLKLVTE